MATTLTTTTMGDHKHPLEDMPPSTTTTTPVEMFGQDPEDNRSTTATSTATNPPEPDHVVAVESWKHPLINRFRVAACLWSFTVLGANDAAVGALIPYLTKDYNITYTLVSLLFITPMTGYLVSSLLNNYLHRTLGRRGVGIYAATCHSIGYAISSTRPPFPVLVIGMCISGLGSGSLDAAWNAYFGKLDRPNELLGVLHGMYGFGAILSPIVATAMVTRGVRWERFYLVMLGMAVVSLVFSGCAFWGESPARYRSEHPLSEGEKTGRRSGRTMEALRNRVTWISGGFLALYVGAEVSLGGWIVTFMIERRGGEAFESGMASSGFWIGFTAGRFVLGYFSGRWGERGMVFVYLLLAIALEMVFWFVPSFHASAVSVAFLGFFIGPLFPSVIVAVTRCLPSRLHVSVIGFAAGIGAGIGATAFPFIAGAIAQARGVQMMHPFVLALFVAQMVLWGLMPTWELKEEGGWVGKVRAVLGLSLKKGEEGGRGETEMVGMK